MQQVLRNKYKSSVCFFWPKSSEVYCFIAGLTWFCCPYKTQKPHECVGSMNRLRISWRRSLMAQENLLELRKNMCSSIVSASPLEGDLFLWYSHVAFTHQSAAAKELLEKKKKTSKSWANMLMTRFSVWCHWVQL